MIRAGKRATSLAIVAAVSISAFGGLAIAQEHGSSHGHAPTAGEHATGHGEHATGEHAADKHATGEHGGHHALPPLNWDDVLNTKQPAIASLVINFLLLAGLYYLFGKKPITEALKQRRLTIGKDIEDARKLLAEAQERAKKYQADLKNADSDAETARVALVSAGKGDAERMLRDANERSARMKRDADHLIVQERKQVQQDLHRETVEIAVEEARKVLERSVTASDHARLAEDLLAELARRPGARDSISHGGAT